MCGCIFVVVWCVLVNGELGWFCCIGVYGEVGL